MVRLLGIDRQQLVAGLGQQALELLDGVGVLALGNQVLGLRQPLGGAAIHPTSAVAQPNLCQGRGGNGERNPE